MSSYIPLIERSSTNKGQNTWSVCASEFIIIDIEKKEKKMSSGF